MPDHTDWDWLALLDPDDDDTGTLDKVALVDRLGPAFAAHRRQGREYIRHALIPVVQHTQQLHDAIQHDVFPTRTQGLALLDDASLRFENAARHDMIAAQAAYDDAKRSLDALYVTLDDLTRECDLLFQAFKASIHEHVQRLRLSTGQIPVDAERLIASLDKKAKHLGAEDHAKAKENLLRGILEKY